MARNPIEDTIINLLKRQLERLTKDCLNLSEQAVVVVVLWKYHTETHVIITSQLLNRLVDPSASFCILDFVTLFF